MALAQLYTAVAGHVITAARWNNEFGNLYNNGTSLVYPATTNISYAGFTVTLDAAGVSTINSPSTIGMNFAPGTKAGTPGTTGNAINIGALTFTDTNTAISGTATSFSAIAIAQPTLAATNTSVTTTDAATLYIANAPAAGTNETITNPWAIWVDVGNVRFDGNLQVAGNSTVTGTSTLTGETTITALIASNFLATKPIGGLTYARAADTSNDITVAIGAASSDDAVATSRRFMNLTSAITGQIDTGTWVVGTDQPKLDTGSVADVPYFIFLIQRADTGVVDILFSASSTSPTMPANYSYKRLIGYFRRASSVNTYFLTYELEGGGLHFIWPTPVADVALADTVTTSRRTDALSVPLSFSVEAIIRVLADDASPYFASVMNPDETDTAPSATTTPAFNLGSNVNDNVSGVEIMVRTSSTGTIATRASLSTITAWDVVTIGFKWSRR